MNTAETFFKLRTTRRLGFELLEDRVTPALMLDIGFDGDGLRTTDFGFGNDVAEAVALQSDGSIIVGGGVSDGFSLDYGLVRYTPDGELDRTFGINGGVRTDFAGDIDRLLGLAVQSDDKIIAVGLTFVTDAFGFRHSDFGIVRYLPNGQLDSTFGNAAPGISLVNFATTSTDDIARDVAVLSNGQILVAGDFLNPQTGTADFALTRLNSNGAIDPSFAINGGTWVDGFGGFDAATAMAVRPDGRIVLAGYGQNGFNGEDIIVMQFTAGGLPDNTFAGGGKTSINFGSGADQAFAVDLQNDGKIVVAGSVFNTTTGLDFALLRLNANGVLDATFGTGGGVLTDFAGGNDRAFSVDVLADGSILASGDAFTSRGADFALAAYDSNGAPDASLLPGDSATPAGTITTDFSLGNDAGVSTYVQSDGSILVVGQAVVFNQTDFGVARYSEPRPGPTGNIDSDGDGLLDIWEINGLDINNDGIVDVNFAALGADPMRRDLFVEVDAMVGRAPLPGVLEAVIESFANAPVTNPDGSTGIRLHVVMDELNLPLENWTQLDSRGFPIGATMAFDNRFGTPAERASGNFANIRAAKEMTFRYGVFANTYGTSGSSGIASAIPGEMFIVTLGTFGAADPNNEGGTFMHELGHTLGLRHGGDTNTNNIPNYFSVMNYLFQFPTATNHDDWRLDYARDAVVHPDWQRIIYIFREKLSDLAGMPGDPVSFPSVEEDVNPNDPVPLDADFDGDNLVRGNDFLIWQRTLGSHTQLAADANRNLTVERSDLTVWMQSFGGDLNAAAAATTPLPANWFLSYRNTSIVAADAQSAPLPRPNGQEAGDQASAARDELFRRWSPPIRSEWSRTAGESAAPARPGSTGYDAASAGARAALFSDWEQAFSAMAQS